MNRRSFLQSILAAGVAPAFVGSRILMPMRYVEHDELPRKIDVELATGSSLDYFAHAAKIQRQIAIVCRIPVYRLLGVDTSYYAETDDELRARVLERYNS